MFSHYVHLLHFPTFCIATLEPCKRILHLSSKRYLSRLSDLYSHIQLIVCGGNCLWGLYARVEEGWRRQAMCSLGLHSPFLHVVLGSCSLFAMWLRLSQFILSPSKFCRSSKSPLLALFRSPSQPFSSLSVVKHSVDQGTLRNVLSPIFRLRRRPYIVVICIRVS